MRIGSNPADPGFGEYRHQLALGNKVRIFLDGQQLRPGICLMADEEQGLVYVLDLDHTGQVQVSPEGNVIQRRLTGEVIVRCTPK